MMTRENDASVYGMDIDMDIDLGDIDPETEAMEAEAISLVRHISPSRIHTPRTDA